MPINLFDNDRQVVNIGKDCWDIILSFRRDMIRQEERELRTRKRRLHWELTEKASFSYFSMRIRDVEWMEGKLEIWETAPDMNGVVRLFFQKRVEERIGTDLEKIRRWLVWQDIEGSEVTYYDT